MDIRHIDVDISLKKWVGEEDEQNVYKNLFNRRMRISLNFPMLMEDKTFRKFLHDQIDKMLDEIRQAMEAK